MKQILFVILCCAGSLGGWISAFGDNVERPNILLALGDNWAWPHASALGDPTVKTPVFDRIAGEGLVFNNAFCPVPSCSPARSVVDEDGKLVPRARRWEKRLEPGPGAKP
jgi:hypothetical protein